MSEFDTTALLEEIRDRGGLPASDSRYSASVLLKQATTEMRDYIVPMIANARAEHGIYPYEVAVTAGTAAYRMPARAVGAALRDVVWTPSGGEAVQLTAKSSSDPWIIDQADESGPPTHYFIRNYAIHLVPIPDVAGTLSLPHYARPNRLISTTSAGVVLSGEDTAADGNYQIVVSGTSIQAAFPAGTEVDVVRGEPGFETVISGTVTGVFPAIPSNSLFEITGLPVSIQLTGTGNYFLCRSGEAPVPQIPVELYGLLIARTALVAVEGTGDTGSTVEGLRRQVADLELRARQWLSPRVESAPSPSAGSLGNNALLGVATGWR